jgi:hypothetical protein
MSLASVRSDKRTVHAPIPALNANRYVPTILNHLGLDPQPPKISAQIVLLRMRLLELRSSPAINSDAYFMRQNDGSESKKGI